MVDASESVASPPTPSPPVPQTDHIHIADIPDSKRIKLDTVVTPGNRPHPLAGSTSSSLSGSEVTAVRQLISGKLWCVVSVCWDVHSLLPRLP